MIHWCNPLVLLRRQVGHGVNYSLDLFWRNYVRYRFFKSLFNKHKLFTSIPFNYCLSHLTLITHSLRVSHSRSLSYLHFQQLLKFSVEWPIDYLRKNNNKIEAKEGCKRRRLYNFFVISISFALFYNYWKNIRR